MAELPVTQSHLNKLRKDKFTLILTIPQILKTVQTRRTRGDEYLNLDSLQFSLYSANIPQINIPEIPLHYAGQNYNITSYDRPAYPPVRVNFAVDNEFKNYWVLWKWMQLLNDPIQSTYAGKNIFPAGAPKLQPDIRTDYQTNIVIRSKDEYNTDKVEFTFNHCFITRLGDIDYNYRDAEEIDCSFEFVFNQLDIHLL